MPEIGPGATALTLTPLGPHSTARCLVIASVKLHSAHLNPLCYSLKPHFVTVNPQNSLVIVIVNSTFFIDTVHVVTLNILYV